ncbi:MAG: PEP/pyruvate-binding domain-containing protein [Bacteroidales bacterium]|nr:PEP/pyruvate-binding domain-containing protein [Bacteroidales bacterium]
MIFFVRKFSEITAQDIASAGGKGANLGEMFRHDIPVPDGFVVLASGFREFLRNTGLGHRLASLLEEVNGDDVDALNNCSQEMTRLILEGNIPDEIRRPVYDYFDWLATPLIAVRSSATAEDGADSAWAGQLDTYLGTTRDKLILNMKKCWASLFTPRALAYRFQKKLIESEIAVAVVVQKMVASEVAGVAFSVHPVTQDPDQMIIEAGFGLGEAVVSGTITPDSYIVRKSDLALLETYPSEQEKGFFLNEKGGSDWRDIPPGQTGKAKLSHDEIIGLAGLIIRIESFFGFPCDIEWARKGKNWYILQCRPITTLKHKRLTDST